MEEERNKVGLVCSFKNCKNKSYDDGANKFYRFPQDVERAKSWLTACDRPDLLDKVETLYKSYRICGIHFHPRMFQKGKRQLLRKDAVPAKLFSNSDVDEAVQSSSGLSIEMPPILQISDAPSKLQQLLESALDICSSSDKAEKSPLRSPTCYVQTPVALTVNTPRKEKLRLQNSTLRKENIELKKQNRELLSKCDDLEKKLAKKEKEIRLEQYKNVPPIKLEIEEVTKLTSGNEHAFTDIADVPPIKLEIEEVTKLSSGYGNAFTDIADVPPIKLEIEEVTKLTSGNENAFTDIADPLTVGTGDIIVKSEPCLTSSTSQKRKLDFQDYSFKKPRLETILSHNPSAEEELQLFKMMCDKFLTKGLAKLVKQQASLRNGECRTRRNSM